MLTAANIPVSPGFKQIVVTLQQTSNTVIYTVPNGKICRGYFLGSAGSALVNNITIPPSTALITLVAGSSIKSTNSGIVFVGVEE